MGNVDFNAEAKKTHQMWMQVRSISKEQLASLKAPLAADDKTNFRPLQPLNGRQVQLYDELGNQ